MPRAISSSRATRHLSLTTLFLNLRTFQLANLLTILALFVACPASAQVATGTPSFGSYAGGPDVINLGNLNAHLDVRVLSKPGRGTNFTYDLIYDNSVWFPLTSGSTTTWTPVNNWGWTGSIPNTVGYATYTATAKSCRFLQETQWVTENYTQYLFGAYVDPQGVSHRTTGGIVQDGGAPDCGPPLTATASAIDGSGYSMSVDNGPDATLHTSTGGIAPLPLNIVSPGTTFTDRNGNKTSSDTSGHFYDTLSSTSPVLTVASTGSPTTQTTLTYTAPSGASATFIVKYTTYSIQTNFGCTSPSIGEFGANGSATAPLVTEIDLPDWNQNSNPNSRYLFTYEDTQGHSGFKTGRLTSITLPTGGTISYTYTAGGLTGSAVGSNQPIVCADGSAAGLQRALYDGTNTNTWTYARNQISGAEWTTTITDPTSAANQTLIYFQKDSAATSTNNFYETQRKVYQGSTSGTLMQTIDTCYNASASPCTATAVSSPITQRDVLPSIPSAGSVTLQSKHTTKYNSVGGLIELDDYAFATAAPFPLLKQTLITYASLGNITAFRQTVTVKNGAGTALAQTNYNYDQTTPVNAPSGTSQLAGPPGSFRGNLTSVQRCTNLTNCSTSLQTTMTYDTAGQLQTVTDPLNNQTSFSYSDKFDDDNGSNPPAAHSPALTYPTDAYVTSVTLPTGNTLGFRYYFNSGAQSTATDQNTKSSYAHFDSFGRPLSTYGPSLPIAGSPSPGNANPWMGIQYTSLTQVDTFTDINDTSPTPLTSCPSSNSCRQDEVKVDGLGRTINAYLKSDPEGQTEVDTVYDALGRVQKAYHPYRTTNDTTYGIETPTYDVLGRTTKVTHPDITYSLAAFGANVTGTNVNTSQLCSSSTYGLGYPSLFTDESGRQREIWTDAFGRTIEGDEPDSNGSLKNSYACYQYDPLGNLLSVVHSNTPSQTRSYVYDVLSRVTSVTIPELANSSGTNCAVTFTYDSNSNVQTRTAPAQNQNASCTAGQITTTYTHDTLNRLTRIQYSDGTTPTVQYAYDGGTLSGCAVAPPSLTDNNKLGTRTAMCDGSGATSWAHDAAGRITTEKRTIQGTSAVTQTISYSYNLDSSIYSVTYPSGKVVNYTVSNAQRLLTAKDSSGAPQYALVASYAATGQFQGMVTGQVNGGFAGINECHSYNTSLEYTSTKATSNACSSQNTGTTMDLGLQYNLNPPSGGQDNGTVTQITNNIDNLRTETLTYDPLNRITQAKSQATSGTDCWGQNFAPDALANLNNITSAQCNSNALSVGVDANNHINTGGFGYDAVGNMLQDGQTGISYSFDAEGRLVKVTGVTNGPWCYVYDGNGLRVAKMSNANSTCTAGTYTTLYWRSLSGDTLTETDGSGSFATPHAFNEYVFFAGRRIASRVTYTTGSTGIFYYFADQLGSTRTITTGSGQNSNGSNQTPGQLCYDQDYTPYGQEVFTTGNMTRLQTTACPPNYEFTGYERDPETGLDYAFARYYSWRLGRFLSTDPLGGSVGDLQSHNAYAYVTNNPLNAIDPAGLTDCPAGHTCGNDNGCDSFWLGDCEAFGRMLYAAMGLIDEFDILELAFTPTCIGCLLNPDFWNDPYCLAGDCPNTPLFLDAYDNWDLLNSLWLQGSGPGGSGGGPGGNQSSHRCLGWARVIAGNPATIGQPGGLSGDTAGDIPVQAGSAAIAPSQWPGVTKDVLRSIGTQISGAANFNLPLDLTRPNTSVPFSFSGVTDIIGPASNQRKLLSQFKRALLIELPSMPQSQDAFPLLRAIALTLPSSLPCPQGTHAE